MAKKFVRGITDVKTISNQDLDTNNVNDLLSDGEHSYIHRKKKDGSQEYHNLTNNIKTIEAEDNGLLTVRNYNNSTNSAKLTVHHDPQKEQKIYSTDHTIEIVHGDNGTGELTNVDTNPLKVLEHDNLQVDYGISKKTSGNTTKLGLEYTIVPTGFDLNTLTNGNVRGIELKNAPDSGCFFVSTYSEGGFSIQRAVKLVDSYNTAYIRRKYAGTWQYWREQVGDKSVIDGLLAQKQNTIVNNASIGVIGNSLQQLYTWYKEYNNGNALLKTFTKEVSYNTNISNVRQEYNFIAKIDKSLASVNFTLNEHDTSKFSNIITTYGQDNTVRISGCVFTLSGSTLTVSTTNNTAQNYVITFSDII